MTDPANTADRFWRFSLDTYAKPGVAPACLALQDDVCLDVNVLLFCCFAAMEGAPVLDAATLAAADTAIQPWRNAAVSPLRTVRRALKTEFQGVDAEWQNGIRGQVQAVELECERVIQSILATCVPVVDGPSESPGALATGAANLAVYLSLANLQPTAAQRSQLAVLLSAAIPETDEAAAVSALQEHL